VALRVKLAPEHALVTDALAVPALGVPEQAGTAASDTDTWSIYK
jgi:hypothetical protein